MKVCVIIPTYQEKENIALLIPAIKSETKELPHQFEILVVDDKSPDGTADSVREIMKQDRCVHLITGNKRGLGAAYIRGFKYVLEKINPDVIFEMDADFSHDPKDLKRLLAEIEKGEDFVIGSRYIKGGAIPSNWSLLQRLNSRWGNRFARYIAGLKTIYDCTAGFRAIRTDLIRKINLDNLNTQGYSFQIRLLYESNKLNARIKEVPVIFKERTAGQTKEGFWDIIEFIIVAFKIRIERLKDN